MVSILLVAVIAGLAIAAGVILVLLITMNSANLSVEGLSTTYTAGEPIDFTIKVKDWDPCEHPNLVIRSENTSEIVWVSRSVINSSCTSQPHETDVSMHPADIGESPIIINQTGSYDLGVSYGDETLRRNFVVLS